MFPIIRMISSIFERFGNGFKFTFHHFGIQKFLSIDPLILHVIGFIIGFTTDGVPDSNNVHSLLIKSLVL